MKLWVKIILSIISIGIAVFVGFVSMIIVAFSSFASYFYIYLAPVAVAILLLFVLAQIWELLKPKTRYILVGVICVAMILSVVGVEINKVYNDSVDTVGNGTDLTLYEPFRENTKAVSLNEPSTLKLTDNLPKIDGATALYPVYSAFARAVYPQDYNVDANANKDVKGGITTPQKVDDIVACTNTTGAYRRLIAGETDIIFVAGPSQEQLQMEKDAKVELKLTPIGREAFVFFVNVKNPINELSISDIQRIYSGEVKNWKEFGGKNSNIRAFQRPENSGSQTTLIKFMGDIPLMTPPTEDVAGGMGDIFKEVSSYKNFENSIGYSFLFYANDMVADNKIKLLKLDGVAPTRENVANQTYPYASEFYAVTAGTNNPNVDKFLEWILSEQGQYLIDKTGYTPLLSIQSNDESNKINKIEKAEYKKITEQEVIALMTDEAVILDVRTQEEFNEGHIKNAILLPDFEIKEKAQTLLLDKAQTILVYCRSGNRSKSASKMLVEMGYTNVYDFGGINTWTGEIVKW